MEVPKPVGKVPAKDADGAKTKLGTNTTPSKEGGNSETNSKSSEDAAPIKQKFRNIVERALSAEVVQDGGDKGWTIQDSMESMGRLLERDGRSSVAASSRTAKSNAF